MTDNVVIHEPYELSVWLNSLKPESLSLLEGSQYGPNETGIVLEHYEEQKIAIIGANDMDTPFAAHNPNLILNVNGSVTLTFEMFYRCFDEWYGKEGDFRDNPYTSLLNNEAKLKFKFRDKWYDLLIKKVEENSDNYTFKYTTSSFFINELSKNGFKVELNTELENNQGTVTDLALKIMEETDWIVDVENSDILVQTITEPIYGGFLSKNILVEKVTDYMPDNAKKDTVPEITQINKGERVYFFYSDLQAEAPQPLILYRPLAFTENEKIAKKSTLYQEGKKNGIKGWYYEDYEVDVNQDIITNAFNYRIIGIVDDINDALSEIENTEVDEPIWATPTDDETTITTVSDPVWATPIDSEDSENDEIVIRPMPDEELEDEESLVITIGRTKINLTVLKKFFKGIYDKIKEALFGEEANVIETPSNQVVSEKEDNLQILSVISPEKHTNVDSVTGIGSAEFIENSEENGKIEFNYSEEFKMTYHGEEGKIRVPDVVQDTFLGITEKDYLLNIFNIFLTEYKKSNESETFLQEKENELKNLLNVLENGKNSALIGDFIDSFKKYCSTKNEEDLETLLEKIDKLGNDKITTDSIVYQQIGDTLLSVPVSQNLLFAPSNYFRGKKVIRNPKTAFDVDLEWPVTIYTRSDKYLRSLQNLDDVDKEFEPNIYGSYIKVDGAYSIDKNPQENQNLTHYSKKEYYGYIHTEDYSPNLAQNYLANSYDYTTITSGWIFDGTPSTQDDLKNGNANSEEDGAFTGKIYYLNPFDFKMDATSEMDITSVLEMRLKNIKNERFYKDSTGKYFKSIVQVSKNQSLENFLANTTSSDGVTYYKLFSKTSPDQENIPDNTVDYISDGLNFTTIEQFIEMDSAAVDDLKEEYLSTLKQIREDIGSDLYETYKDKTDEELEQICNRVINDQRYSKSPRVVINTGFSSNREVIKSLNKGEQYIFAISLGRYKEGEDPPEYGDFISYGSTPPEARYKFVAEEYGDIEAIDFAVKELIRAKDEDPLEYVAEPWKRGGPEYQKVYNINYDKIRQQYDNVFYNSRGIKGTLDGMFRRIGGKDIWGIHRKGAWNNGDVFYRTAYRLALTQLLSSYSTWKHIAKQAKIAYVASNGITFEANMLTGNVMDSKIKEIFSLKEEAFIDSLSSESAIRIDIDDNLLDEDEQKEVGNMIEVYKNLGDFIDDINNATPSAFSVIINKGLIYKNKTLAHFKGVPGHFQSGITHTMYIPNDFSVCTDEDCENIAKGIGWGFYRYPNYADEQNRRVLLAIQNFLKKHQNETFGSLFENYGVLLNPTMKEDIQKELKKAIKKAIRELWSDILSPSREKNARLEFSLSYPVKLQLNHGGYEYQKWAHWWDLYAKKMAEKEALKHSEEFYGYTSSVFSITKEKWSSLGINDKYNLIKLDDSYFIPEHAKKNLEEIIKEYKDTKNNIKKIVNTYGLSSGVTTLKRGDSGWYFLIPIKESTSEDQAYAEKVQSLIIRELNKLDQKLIDLQNRTSIDLENEDSNNYIYKEYYLINPLYVYLLNHENDILRLNETLRSFLKLRYNLPLINESEITNNLNESEDINKKDNSFNYFNIFKRNYFNINNMTFKDLYPDYAYGLSISGGLLDRQFVSDYLFLFSIFLSFTDSFVSDNNIEDYRNTFDQNFSFPFRVGNKIISYKEEIPCPDEFLQKAWYNYSKERENYLPSYTYIHQGGNFDIVDLDTVLSSPTTETEEEYNINIRAKIDEIILNGNFGEIATDFKNKENPDVNIEKLAELEEKVKAGLKESGITGIMMPVGEKISANSMDLYVKSYKYDLFTPDKTALQTYKVEENSYDFKDYLETFQNYYVFVDGAYVELIIHWNNRVLEENYKLRLLKGKTNLERRDAAETKLRELIKEILNLPLYTAIEYYESFSEEIHGNPELYSAVPNLDFTKAGSYYLQNGKDESNVIFNENGDLDYVAGYFRPYEESLDREPLDTELFDGQMGVSYVYDPSYELLPCYDGLVFYYPDSNEEWLQEARKDNEKNVYNPVYFKDRPFDSNGEQLFCVKTNAKGSFVKTADLDGKVSNWLGSISYKFSQWKTEKKNNIKIFWTNFKQSILSNTVENATDVNNKVDWLINDNWLQKESAKLYETQELLENLTIEQQTLRDLKNDLYQEHKIDFVLVNNGGHSNAINFYDGTPINADLKKADGNINDAMNSGIGTLYSGYYFKTRGNQLVDTEGILRYDENDKKEGIEREVQKDETGKIISVIETVKITDDDGTEVEERKYIDNINRAFDEKFGTLYPPDPFATQLVEETTTTIKLLDQGEPEGHYFNDIKNFIKELDINVSDTTTLLNLKDTYHYLKAGELPFGNESNINDLYVRGVISSIYKYAGYLQKDIIGEGKNDEKEEKRFCDVLESNVTRHPRKGNTLQPVYSIKNLHGLEQDIKNSRQIKMDAALKTLAAGSDAISDFFDFDNGKFINTTSYKSFKGLLKIFWDILNIADITLEIFDYIAVLWLLKQKKEMYWSLKNVERGDNFGEIKIVIRQIVEQKEQFMWSPPNSTEKIEIIPFSKYRGWAFNYWGKDRYEIIPLLAAKRTSDTSPYYKLLNDQKDLRKQTYVYVPLEEMQSVLTWVYKEYSQDLLPTFLPAFEDIDTEFSYTLSKQEKLIEKYGNFWGKIFATAVTNHQKLKASAQRTFRVKRGLDTSISDKQLVTRTVKDVYDITYSLYSMLYKEADNIQWVHDNKVDYYTVIKDDQWGVTTYEPRYVTLGKKKDGTKTLYYYDHEKNYFRPYKSSDATRKLFDKVVGSNMPVFDFVPVENGTGRWMYFAAKDWYIPINKDKFVTPKRYRRVRDYDNGTYVSENGDFVNIEGYMNKRLKYFRLDYSDLEVSFCDTYNYDANSFAIDLNGANLPYEVYSANYDENKEKYLYFDCSNTDRENFGYFDTTVTTDSIIESKTKERWVYWKAEVQNSFSLTEDRANPVGIVFNSKSDKDYAFIGMQLFKYYPYYADITYEKSEQAKAKNNTSQFIDTYVEKRMVIPGEVPDTNELSYQSYYIYDPDEMNNVDNITYEYIGMEPFENGWAYSYDEKCQKIRSIKGKESNYFNLLQSLCETFECWVDFVVDNDEQGNMKYHDIPIYIEKNKNYQAIKQEETENNTESENDQNNEDEEIVLTKQLKITASTYPYKCIGEIPIEVKQDYIIVDTDAYDELVDQYNYNGEADRTVAAYYNNWVQDNNGYYVKDPSNDGDFIEVEKVPNSAALSRYSRQKKSEKQINLERRRKAIEFFENPENVEKFFEIKYMRVPIKKIVFKEYVGTENYAGFKYGINLKGIKRNIDSSQFTSKIIVKPNNNKYADNKFCTIQRAQDNFLKENFFYNFDYYLQHGLLSNEDLINDLYSDQDEHLGYFTKLNYLNKDLEVLASRLADLSVSIDKIKADYETASLGRQAATEEIQNLINLIQTNYGKYGQLIDSPWTFNKSKQYIERADKGVTTLAHTYEAVLQINGVETNSVLNIPTTMLSVDYPKYNDVLRTWFDEMDIYQNKYRAYYNAEMKFKALLKDREKEKRELEDLQQVIIKKKNELIIMFYQKYSRYIQEGVWTNNEYLDDNLYFLDSLSVLRNSAFPKVSYQVSVVDLYPLEDYKIFDFKIGNRTYVEDVEFFGYKNGMPAKEEIIISEISYFPEDPIKNSIKVQNYRTQFEDLFKRITTQSQQLKFSEGNYGVSTLSLGTALKQYETGGLNISDINFNTDLFLQSNKISLSKNGIELILEGDSISFRSGNQVKIIASAKGVSADQLFGEMNLDSIVIGSSSKPGLKLDRLGLTAYAIGNNGTINYNKFVRHDNYGIYGINLSTYGSTINDTFTGGLDEIENKASFALTWNGFMLRSGDNENRVKIGTDTDIRMQSTDGSNWKDRLVIGRLKDRNNEEYYGFRIMNNKDEVVMETEPDGELYLKRRLRIANFSSSYHAVDPKTLISKKDENGDIYYVDPYTGMRSIESKVNLGIVELFKRTYDNNNKNVFNKIDEIPDNYDTATYLTKVFSIAVNDAALRDKTIFEQFSDEQIREYEKFEPYVPRLNDDTQLYIYDEEEHIYKEYTPEGIYSKNYDVEKYYEEGGSGNNQEYKDAAKELNELQFYRKVQQTGLLAKNETFALFDNGNLIAKNAYVEGNIRANTGRIGDLLIEGGDLYSKNYDKTGTGFIIKSEGIIKIGRTTGDNIRNITLDGNQEVVYGGKDSINFNWKITPELAIFKNANISGVLRTAVFEKQTVQAIGGIVYLKTAFNVLENISTIVMAGVVLDTTYKDFMAYCNLERDVYQLIGEPKVDDNDDTTLGMENYYLQVSSVEPYKYKNEEKVLMRLPLEVFESIQNIKMVIRLDMNEYNETLSLTLNGTEFSTPQILPQAITFSTLKYDRYADEKISAEPHLVLGRINDEISSINDSMIGGDYFLNQGYGLYADNAFLKGTLALEDADTTAGVSTNYVAEVPVDLYGTIAEKNIVFWASDKSSADNNNWNFYVTSEGYLYAKNGYFSGTIEAAEIISPIIKGTAYNSPALSLLIPDINLVNNGEYEAFVFEKENNNNSNDRYFTITNKRILSALPLMLFNNGDFAIELENNGNNEYVKLSYHNNSILFTENQICFKNLRYEQDGDFCKLYVGD